MNVLDGVRGVLLDIDGTLLRGDRAIEGVPEMIARLRDRGMPFRLVTNTTRRPRGAMLRLLQGAGIDASEDEILAPSVLARRRILESGRRRAALLVAPESRVDFEGVEVDESSPDWVVVGDLGSGFTWDVLNRAFGWLRGGASLIALQKNRYWDAGDGSLRIDAGPFVVALEYAAGIEAELVGKPSRGFFELALEDLGVGARDVVVVGDDIRGDCAGGAGAGCRTVLVRTGKFRPGDLEPPPEGYPDAVVDSAADLFR